MTVKTKGPGVAMSLIPDPLQSCVPPSAGTPTHATPLAAIRSRATLADPSTVTLAGPSVTPGDPQFATPADP